MLGADIMASTAIGEHGAGLMVNDSLAADREYRLVITGSTFAAGTLLVWEDGSVEFTGAGTATQGLYDSSYLVNTAPLDAGFLPPEYIGTLPGLTQARTMAAVTAGYAPPSYAGLLAGIQLAPSMGAIAGTYTPPGVPVLPAMQVARSMPAIVGSYSAPTYSGTLGALQVAVGMPSVLAVYTPPVTEQAPIISQQPRSITVQAGRYAAFQVSAQNATSYQWRRNSAPIAGATKSAYTTDPVQALDSGAVFDVVVSNNVGPTTSTAASLTVVAAPASRSRSSALRVLRVKPQGPATTLRVN